jgi:hypothetical protein
MRHVLDLEPVVFRGVRLKAHKQVSLGPIAHLVSPILPVRLIFIRICNY